MKKLLEMIQHVRLHGIAVSDTVEDYHPTRPKSESVDLFYSLVERAQPFVLLMKGKTPIDLADSSETFDPKAPIDAPFPVYSIEMLGDAVHITQPRDSDRVRIYTLCLLAFETQPNEFLTYVYTRTHHEGQVSHHVMLTVAFNDVLRQLTHRINTEQTGFVTVNEKVKVGTGNSKRFVKIKRVVYVRPKKAAPLGEETEPELRKVEWTHRFWVRGHWRKIEGLGKNRDGVYCVEGHTWVSEHAKGPEEMPLIQKTRVVV